MTRDRLKTTTKWIAIFAAAVLANGIVADARFGLPRLVAVGATSAAFCVLFLVLIAFVYGRNES